MRAVDKTKSTLNSASATRTTGSAGSTGKSNALVKLGSPECALQSLAQLRLEILSGLCYQVKDLKRPITA